MISIGYFVTRECDELMWLHRIESIYIYTSRNRKLEGNIFKFYMLIPHC